MDGVFTKWAAVDGFRQSILTRDITMSGEDSDSAAEGK